MLKIEGFDELQNKLQDLANKAGELDGEHSIPIAELLSDDFISENTKFSTIDELFEASGFEVGTQEDFVNIPDLEWDEHIRTHSSFENWQEMLNAASQEWVVSKLSL